MGLDHLVYDGLVFSFKDRTGWDAFRWYSFERASREARTRQAEILIVGSSVAQYSLQEKSLARHTGKSTMMFTHAALMPVDLYHYRQRIEEARPDLLIYIFNAADFDLERLTYPWEAGPLEARSAVHAYLDARHPVSFFYPLEYALHQELPLLRRSELFLKGIFHGLRWGQVWREVYAYNEEWQGPLRRYLNYQGLPVPEGLFREGLTGACFTLAAVQLPQGQLLLQVPEGLQPVTVSYYPLRETQDETCRVQATPLGKASLERSGWQKIEVGEGSLFFVLSHVLPDRRGRAEVRAGGPVYQGRGVRLAGNSGISEMELPDRYVRRESLEDRLLADLSPAAYRADFFARLEADDWQSREFQHLRQFHTLRLAKYALGWTDFQETRQFLYLKEFLTKYKGRVLLINNPESPLTLSVYRNTAWYEGYLSYLRALSGNRVTFVDLSGFELPPQSFIDAHHLSYPGMQSMQEEYARWARDAGSN